LSTVDAAKHLVLDLHDVVAIEEIASFEQGICHRVRMRIERAVLLEDISLGFLAALLGIDQISRKPTLNVNIIMSIFKVLSRSLCASLAQGVANRPPQQVWSIACRGIISLTVGTKLALHVIAAVLRLNVPIQLGLPHGTNFSRSQDGDGIFRRQIGPAQWNLTLAAFLVEKQTRCHRRILSMSELQTRGQRADERMGDPKLLRLFSMKGVVRRRFLSLGPFQNST